MSIAIGSPKRPQARAFTLKELLILTGCVGLLVALLLPALARSKARSSRINCANCLKQIGLSFGTWAIDNDDRFPMQVSVEDGGTKELITSGAVYPHFQVMSNELSTPLILRCPNDEKRTYATNWGADLTDRKLSYFLNVDATNDAGSMLLSGDRNITNRARAGSRLVPLTRTDTLAWTREIHSQKGHLGFSDGSVASFSNGEVGAVLKIESGFTNRLTVP